MDAEAADVAWSGSHRAGAGVGLGGVLGEGRGGEGAMKECVLGGAEPKEPNDLS